MTVSVVVVSIVVGSVVQFFAHPKRKMNHPTNRRERIFFILFFVKIIKTVVVYQILLVFQEDALLGYDETILRFFP